MLDLMLVRKRYPCPCMRCNTFQTLKNTAERSSCQCHCGKWHGWNFCLKVLIKRIKDQLVYECISRTHIRRAMRRKQKQDKNAVGKKRGYK